MTFVPVLVNRIEIAVKAVGVTAVFTGLKSAVEYIANRSLEQRRSRAVKAIDACLRRLATARKEAERGTSVEGYERELEKDLEERTAELRRVRDAERESEKRSEQDPEGVRKWLALYKPEGFHGWIAQFWFYWFVIVGCLGVFSMVLGAQSWHEPSEDIFRGLMVALVASIPYYFWSASLRFKRLGNARRRGEIGDLNSDLNWRKKVFLRFQNAWEFIPGYFLFIDVRTIYYFCLSGVVMMPFELLGERYRGWESFLAFAGLIAALECVCASWAETIRADVLARRAEVLMRATARNRAAATSGVVR